MKKHSPGKKTVIGVTGSCGSGKSTVAAMFAGYGARLIDADRIGHEVLRRSEVRRRLVRIFGSSVLIPGKRFIDRQRLGEIVFSDAKQRLRLSRVLHPLIIQAIRVRLDRIRTGIVVLDAPLLLEAGLRPLVDILVVVSARRAQQICRIQKKCRLSRAQILARIRSQMPLNLKERAADFVIDNSGSIAQTKKQVALLRRQWWRS